MRGKKQNEFLTPEQEEQVRAMREKGLSWYAISKQLDLTYYTVRSIEPGYVEKCRQRGRKSSKARTNPESSPSLQAALARKRELAEKLATIPEDTRDMTARLMGDPLPGRSSLDLMRGRAG